MMSLPPPVMVTPLTLPSNSLATPPLILSVSVEETMKLARSLPSVMLMALEPGLTISVLSLTHCVPL